MAPGAFELIGLLLLSGVVARETKKYCDKLNNKNISDQISNWLSTEDEKSNNKNPFNNYRGIRTLEFQTRNEIPAFFLFITTLSKRKDDNANIWTDKYNNETTTRKRNFWTCYIDSQSQ